MSQGAKAMGWRGQVLMALALSTVSAAHAADTTNSGQVHDKAEGPGKPTVAVAPGKDGAGAPEATAAPPWWSLQSMGVDSWGDILQRGTWSGSLETSYDQQSQTIRAPDSAELQYKSRLMIESLSIKNEGFSLIDPRLLTGNLGMRFFLQQSRQTAGDELTAQRGLLTDYSFDATVLPEKPYNATFVANRAQSLNTQPSGGSSQVASEHRSVTLRLREDSLLRDKEILPYFSGKMRVEQQSLQQVTRTLDQSFRLDDRRKLFDMECHNGFETADLDFHYEHSDYVNLTYSSGDYRSNSASLGYSLDFGPTLNRRWDSRVSYGSRDGSTKISNFSVDEALSIEHYPHLSSAYNYQFTRQTTPDGSVTAHNGGMNLQHQLYANLTTSLGLTASQQVLPNGRRGSEGASLNFSYKHWLPWSGQFTTSLGANAQVSNNQMVSSFMPVYFALYQAPLQLGAGAGFVLTDRFIVAESVSVLDIKGSARIPTMAGVDYLLVIEGDQMRILPQPTSAIIQPGDQLEVSYIYLVDPSVKYRSISRSASLGVDWSWIGVSLSRDASAQKPLSGGDSTYLTSSTRDTARLNLQADWEELQALGDATLTRYNDVLLAYDERRFNAHFNYRPIESLMLSLSANQYRIDYLSPQRQSLGRSINLSADWAAAGWLTTVNVSRRQLIDTQVPSETFREASLKLHRKWSKLDVAVMFGLAERLRGGSQSTNAMARIAVVRQF